MTLNNFWYAAATLAGTIVGVGMFGLPFVASRAGFFVAAVYLIAGAAVFTLLHLMFGEIMLRTAPWHRLAGYAGIYCGAAAKRFFSFTALVGLSAGMLVYILVGGVFLKELFDGVFSDVWMAQVVFWAAMSVLLALGLRTIKQSELIMFVLMAGIIVFLFGASIPHLQPEHLKTFSVPSFFLPYGVVLFALAGGAAIPAVRDILKGEERVMKRAIVAGTLIPALLYLLFVIAVVGVSGSATTENALSGLRGVLGGATVLLGAMLGILLIATSYIVFGLYLKDTLRYDMGVPGGIALSCAVFFPFALLFFRWRSFIEIIGLLGALLGGMESILLIVIYRRARVRGDRRPEYALGVSDAALYALAFVFAAGMAYALFFNGSF